MKNKIKIIDAICKKHPSYGVDKGWSEYTGGMVDSGNWFFRKMLDCSENELQTFLDDIIEQENKPRKSFISIPPQTKEEAEILNKFLIDMECNMVFGK